jgi:hypothetical protein
MIKKSCKILIIILFSVAALFLYTNLCVLYGSIKEREGKSCIGPIELSTYKETLMVAETICVGVQKDRSDELSKCRDEIQKWRDSYFYIKSQKATTTTL